MSRPGTRPALLTRLVRSRSGVAMTEFALAMPMMLTAGLWGLETVNQAMMQMEVSQLAVHVADNASRIGDISMLENRKIYESDIDDVFIGANLQAGRSFDLYEHGRVILSSLEVVEGTEDQQYIHWQRCLGKRLHESSYGDEGDGEATGIDGMGPDGEKIYAFPGEAVMFVEISYEYQPLISGAFSSVEELNATAAFTVRSDRDLSQVYQRDPANPDPVSTCDDYRGVDSLSA